VISYITKERENNQRSYRGKIMKVKLSEIKTVAPGKLKRNMENSKYFKTIDGSQLDQLVNDIKNRGILVPLVAKSDGTLLAGHRRLMVAKHLKMKYVPVQYIEQKITKKQEKEFIIKDNLLRRHLSPAERRALYNAIVPDFEERVKLKNSKLGVKPGDIADETGLNPQTIGYDLARIRREKLKEENDNLEINVENEKAIAKYKKAVVQMLNTAIVEKLATIDEFTRITSDALEKLKQMKGDK
jgi:ParB-like chromosome segregation protein Spo0J